MHSDQSADPTKSARFRRSQMESCFGCRVYKSDSEFFFEARGGQLCFSANGKKPKKATQFQSYFNHIVAYTPVVCRIDPAIVDSSLAIHNHAPLNPSLEMSEPAIKERFAPLVVEGEVPLAGLHHKAELGESHYLKKRIICCFPTGEHDNSMLVTNRRIMLYNIEKEKAPCCSTFFCSIFFCAGCKQGKSMATHSVTIADAQYLEGAQLFYMGPTFRLCCCGLWCKKKTYNPRYDLVRTEIHIDGIDFRQKFLGARPSTLTNRMFQIISAVSQAAQIDKIAAERFVEDGLARKFVEQDHSQRFVQMPIPINSIESHRENVGKLQASLDPQHSPSSFFLNHDEHILQVIMSDATNPVVHFTLFWILSFVWKVITTCFFWLCMYEMGQETIKNVLILTNQRLIKFKESTGSKNGDFPRRCAPPSMS